MGTVKFSVWTPSLVKMISSKLLFDNRLMTQG